MRGVVGYLITLQKTETILIKLALDQRAEAGTGCLKLVIEIMKKSGI